jgi:hypothetical protein
VQSRSDLDLRSMRAIRTPVALEAMAAQCCCSRLCTRARIATVGGTAPRDTNQEHPMSGLASLPASIRSAAQDPALNPGASQKAIDAAAKAGGVQFPADYVALLRGTNGAEFTLGETLVTLYPVEALAAENVPDDDFPAHFFVFGDNGGGEQFAFDKRERPHPIVVVPLDQPEEDEALPQGTTLHGFLERVLAGDAFDG